MILFDTSFLIEYLDGAERTRAFLDANEGRPFFAPSLVLFEVYRGVTRTGGEVRLDAVQDRLAWLEPIPLDAGSAREAARIEAELLDAGQPINLGDVLVAGVCRHHGSLLVTDDDHFDRIDGVETLSY